MNDEQERELSADIEDANRMISTGGQVAYMTVRVLIKGVTEARLESRRLAAEVAELKLEGTSREIYRAAWHEQQARADALQARITAATEALDFGSQAYVVQEILNPKEKQ